MDRRIWLAYFVTTAMPGIAAIPIQMATGRGEPSAALAMVPLFLVFGTILTAPLILPVLYIGARTGCITFVKCILGAAACTAIWTLWAHWTQTKLRPPIFKEEWMYWANKAMVASTGALVGCVIGLIFALILYATGYFRDQKAVRV
ncbi:MAG: hypothetical protein V4601_04600 [Pseudomonadota bacterium]